MEAARGRAPEAATHHTFRHPSPAHDSTPPDAPSVAPRPGYGWIWDRGSYNPVSGVVTAGGPGTYVGGTGRRRRDALRRLRRLQQHVEAAGGALRYGGHRGAAGGAAWEGAVSTDTQAREQLHSALRRLQQYGAHSSGGSGGWGATGALRDRGNFVPVINVTDPRDAPTGYGGYYVNPARGGGAGGLAAAGLAPGGGGGSGYLGGAAYVRGVNSVLATNGAAAAGGSGPYGGGGYTGGGDYTGGGEARAAGAGGGGAYGLGGAPLRRREPNVVYTAASGAVAHTVRTQAPPGSLVVVPPEAEASAGAVGADRMDPEEVKVKRKGG